MYFQKSLKDLEEILIEKFSDVNNELKNVDEQKPNNSWTNEALRRLNTKLD